jgi:tetratricopeptide (TPR) repeat protein
MIWTRRTSRPSFGAAPAALAAVAVLLALSGGLRAQENLGRGRVSGKVVDAGKQPVEGVKIVAQSLTAAGTRLEGRTDAGGGFVVGGMGTGPWRFTASKRGYQDATLDVEVHQLRGNPPIVLVLKDSTTAPLNDDGRTAAEAALDNGNRLLAAENYAEAREVLEQFLSSHPDAYRVRLQIGQCGIRLGDLAGAEKSFQALLDEIVKRSGSYAKDTDLATQALAGLGEAAVKRNDIEAGMAYFRQALEISPTNEKVAYNIAEIFFAAQKVDEAIPYYRLAIDIRKDWPKPYHKLGLAYLNKGEYPKALECLRKFVALDPDNPAALEARNLIAAIERMK